MKIRITKCSDDSYWYKDRIGEQWLVSKEFKSGDGVSYYVLDNPDKSSMIKLMVEFGDCERVWLT